MSYTAVLPDQFRCLHVFLVEFNPGFVAYEDFSVEACGRRIYMKLNHISCRLKRCCLWSLSCIHFGICTVVIQDFYLFGVFVF